ncbi:type II restriction endonuclease [Fusobacterium necrophorum]|uniref:Eco57I restriction-modification methylase domain-containing protein n=1 Tax=Fusobacterium necrophorum TaxID=859 RepID=UPI0010118327|nr:N-6 DNA methylase [Fusobacterium necrophorum]RXZ28572.1 type II restriction endonuclease [Fusobacterium necrophorum]
MNIEKKQKIINNLLENKFNIDNFKEFTANILNLSIKNRHPSEAIYKVFREYIEAYQEISEITDKDGNKFYVLAVKIKEEKDPVRARIKQREFIANILRGRNKRGAFVAFFNEGYSHWRISFIKLDYEFTSKGFEEKLTPAKRLSYVVGEGEACKTAKDQFFSLTKLENEVSLNELEEIFALEKVTNDFFKEYKNKYLDIKELLIQDNTFMTEAKKHDTENPESFAEGFSKKLMGQLAFLYFLQKKGWLGIKILPETLNQQEFNRVYNRALNIEKEILEKAYNKINSNLYILRKEELPALLSREQIDLLVNPFKNTEYFNEWGRGDKKFIRNLYEEHRREDANNEKIFFKDYLEVLFYNNLSKERGEIQYSLDFNCRIPFLNGGLFDPYGDYDWQTTSFHLSDDIFSNKDKTGILDIFDIYNFTINENDSYETEVAVDPEMLGKVFENLLDVSDRKSKGAFYTPREIVRYMTNESIMNYLLTNLEEKNITKEELDYLFNFGEFTKEYDQQIFEKDYIKDKKPLTKNIFGMPRNIIANSILIDTLLSKVKIVDPACGSGAFPLGILNEIVRARNILTFYINMIEVLKEKDEQNYWKRINKKQNMRKLYSLKLYTIQNCLHGVDIEPSAIDITKLRLWLSILVDSDNNNVKPLPNLDFNFMIGNSLVDEFEGMKLFDESLLDDTVLEELKKEKKYKQMSLLRGTEEIKEDILKEIFSKQAKYFEEKDSQKKKELKKEIEDSENSLIKFTLETNGNLDKLLEIEKGRKERRKPYFLWKLEFAKVFKENGGFDIVIGNPPYVRYEKFKEEKNLYQKNYVCFAPSVDLYILFFELGYTLLKKAGNLTFITSNKWLKTKYGKEFRKFILEKNKIISLIDLGSNIFETASVDTAILSLEKKACFDYTFSISSELGKMSEFSIKNFTSELFFILPNNLYTVKLKIEKKGVLLKNKNYKIRRGILTGCNDAFVINEFLFNELKKDSENLEIIYPVLKGKNISKYKINFDKNYLLATKNGIDIKKQYPKIYNYLNEKNILLKGGLEKRYDKGNHWTNLRNCSYYKEFKKEKIIYPEFSSSSSFCWEEGNYFNLDTTWFISGNISKSLLGILNSKLVWFYLKIISVQLGTSALRMKKIYLDNLPIVNLSIEEENRLIQNVDKIIELKKLGKDTQELENQIDEMVYDLYELTEEEKELVKNF